MNHFYHDRVSGANWPTQGREKPDSPVNSFEQNVFGGKSDWNRVLESLPLLVWRANESGAIMELNQRWQEYTGAPKTEALGFGFLNFVDPQDRDRFLTSWSEAVSNPKSWEVQFRLQRPDGNYRWMLLQAAPVWNEEDGRSEWAVTATDIDLIKQSQIHREREGNFLKALLAKLLEEASSTETNNLQLFNKVMGEFYQVPNSPLSADLQAPERETQTITENLRRVIRVSDEQQKQLGTLQRLTNLLNERVADLQGLLQVMVGAVGSAIADAQFCLLALYESDRGYLKLTAVSGIDSLPLGKPISTGDGLLYRVFTTGQSELVRRKVGDKFCLGNVPAAVYAVAIESARAGRLGVLVIGNWETAIAFNQGAQQLLEAVGKQAAIAIDNARLIETLEQREKLLERQNQVLAAQNRELESQRHWIQLQNLQLLEAAQIKSQFLTTVSHELRTPMNAIIGFSELLLRQRQQPLSARQGDIVQRILKNGKNLLILIDDILDLSKIEAGRVELELQEFDLTDLAIAIALEFSGLANEKNLAISVCVHLQNRYIVNDRDRLQQVLVNLISNAIKFTHKGGIYLEVCEVGSERIAIAVRDTGIGIAQKDLPHIFEMFRQVDQTIQRQYSGTGLGLAITNSLVAMMQGSISVDSQLGKGSVFRIEFPRQISKK